MDFSSIDIGMYVQVYGLKILIAIVILVGGLWLSKWLTSLIRKSLSKTNIDQTLADFIGDVARALMVVVVVIAALTHAGVNMTSLVAILGAVGLAIGLALQGSVANIGASVLLMVFRPFSIGDYVEAGGTSGTVENMSLFMTTLKTPDNKAIYIPNSIIIGSHITNYSKKDTRRVDWVFGVSYEDDIKTVRQTLEELICADERVLKDPEYFIGVGELADSSVNFVVRAWVKSEDYWGLKFDMTERVKLAFDEKGITIPFPQVELNKKEA